jgi:CDP-diacylglycerol---serine O-phosphatidyltransferase
MYKHIPNTITSLNLLAGCIGIYYLSEVNIQMAALLIFIAALFDFLDGFSARLLKAYSPVGKSLDSLADLVSFGTLPGLLLVKLQLNIAGQVNVQEFLQGQGFYHFVLILSPLLIPLASAIRLARFDNDPSQTMEFRGLPTPANAIFIAALVYSVPDAVNNLEILRNPNVLLSLNIILAFLLISPFRFLSLKVKNYTVKDNIARYLVVILFICSIIIWKIPGIMIGMGCYMLISLAGSAFQQKKQTYLRGHF